MSNMTVDTLRIKGWARTVQSLAAQYDVELPAAHACLSQVAAAATRAAFDARMGASPVPLPDDPAKVAAVVKKAATERVALREAVTVAEDMAERAETAATRLALDAGPQVAQAIKQRFDAAAVELVEMAPTTPTAITAGSNADDSAAYTRALALVETLTSAVHARIALVPVLGEELRGAVMAWLVLDPHRHVSRDTINQAVADFTETPPSDLEGWLRVTALGASLAAPGEAQIRASSFTGAVFASGHGSPDGGMLDRSLGDMLRAADAQQAAQ